MASRRLLLVLLLPCLALGTPDAGIGVGTSCHTLARPAGPGGRTWRSFLWRRPDGRPLTVVQSAWDPRGRLLACAWRTEPRIVRWYEGLCQESADSHPRTPGLERAVWGPELDRALEALEAQKDTCAGSQHPSTEEEKIQRSRSAPPAKLEGSRGRTRIRRGLTMPGTLWCGAGDSAGHAFELGVFQGPDVCCREHDLCEAQIPALGYKYGMRNYRFHTVSHCDCDVRFRHCLMDLNDPISNLVGISFFNLLEVPCFVMEESEDCLEWTWWGECKRHGPTLLAHLIEQSHYEPLSPLTEKPSLPTTPDRPRRRKGKSKKHHRKNRKNRKRFRPKVTEAPEHSMPWSSIAPSTAVLDLTPQSPETTSSELGPGWRETLPPLASTVEHASEPGGLLKTGVALPTEQPDIQEARPEGPDIAKDVGQKGKAIPDAGGHQDLVTPNNIAPSKSCSCYRRLDQCPYRIAPNEVKYQLHNVDFRTLFHCNCTRRLARFLRRTKGPNEVEGEVLSNYVSSSCFVLESPPGCMEGQDEWPNCVDVGRAILAPARHLTNRLMHRPLGNSPKVKRQERALPGRSFRLFDKCMQLAQASSSR